MTKKTSSPPPIIFILFFLGLGFGGYWRFYPQIGIQTGGEFGSPNKSPQNISTGERVLISEKLNADKQSGVEAFAKGNWNEAIAKFQASLQQNPNDPETRIYLNNAKNNNTKALKINRWVSALRLSVTGQNLFISSNYTGYDPEVNTDRTINGVSSYGIDYLSYPKAKTFVFGLNVSF